MAKATGFGSYLRQMRMRAGLSLRDVAAGLGVSHVYLGEVERGVRGALKQDHWPKLKEILPGVSIEKLNREATLSKPVQLSLEDAPPKYQDLGLALARRIESRDIDQKEMRRLLSILVGVDGE